MAITISGIDTTNNSGLLDVGVRPGDEVVVLTVSGNSTPNLFTGLAPGTDYDNILVTQIVSNSSFMMDAYLNGTPLGLTVSNLAITGSVDPTDAFTYNIVHNYTKPEQVALISAIAESYASRRIVCVWPPLADWSDGNGGTIQLDGSALCAALAGAVSAYPAQQSFTNLPFAGPKKLYYSNDYFTPDQLKELSAAGVFVLMQDTVGGQVYSRHQVTTDMTSIETQEFSVTKAVDQIANDLYDAVKPKIGKFNITPNLLTQLNEDLDHYCFAAQNASKPYCGPLMLSSKNLTIAANLNGQNTDIIKGRIRVSLNCEVGYPANNIDITVNVD